MNTTTFCDVCGISVDGAGQGCECATPSGCYTSVLCEAPSSECARLERLIRGVGEDLRLTLAAQVRADAALASGRARAEDHAAATAEYARDRARLESALAAYERKLEAYRGRA